ncbi:MAG: hypothetical protein KGL39_36485 [Patescibacteria group bacterium]|nr:hypothetical protein [Patescibacteria group bacterium]
MEPASIRYKNPGAMWGNALARKWGAEPAAVVLHDGLGQGNNIAVFPDFVHGAAAQFDLWRSHYCGLTLQEAITKWSGGNSSTAYMNHLCSHTGLTPSSPIMPSVLSGPTGLKLMKAQAQWEAGRPYPMSDEDWAKAQKMVFESAKGTLGDKTAAPVPIPSSPSTATQPKLPQSQPQPSLLQLIINFILSLFK